MTISLLDMKPTTKTVDLGGQSVEVPGFSVLGAFGVIERFQVLQDLINGGLQITPKTIYQEIPESIPALIAAGCGYPGNEEAEAKAASLPIAYQFQLLEVVLTVSMPDGPAPLFESLGRMLRAIGLSPSQTTDQPTQGEKTNEG